MAVRPCVLAHVDMIGERLSPGGGFAAVGLSGVLSREAGSEWGSASVDRPGYSRPLGDAIPQAYQTCNVREDTVQNSAAEMTLDQKLDQLPQPKWRLI